MIYELKPIQLLLLLNFIIFENERYNRKGGVKFQFTDINELQLERYWWSFARKKNPSAVTWN